MTSDLERGNRAAGPADRGATAVEYALMTALVAGVIVVVLIGFGADVAGLFDVPFTGG